MGGIIADVNVRDEGPVRTAASEYEAVTLELHSSAAGEGTVAPCARVRGPSAAIDAVASSFEAEPTIASYRRLSDDREDELDGEDRYGQRTYWIEWVDDRSVVGRLARRNGSVLAAGLEADGWHVRLLFPSHGDLSNAYERWEAEEWTLSLQRIVSCEEAEVPDVGVDGLTGAQRRSLERAVERGYYDVPRRVDVGELADDLGISHQALSERLRRASRNLVTDVVSDPDDPEGPTPGTIGSGW